MYCTAHVLYEIYNYLINNYIALCLHINQPITAHWYIQYDTQVLCGAVLLVLPSQVKLEYVPREPREDGDPVRVGCAAISSNPPAVLTLTKVCTPISEEIGTLRQSVLLSILYFNVSIR